MINLRVKTIWQGKVGVNEKYIKRALDNKEGLCIKNKDEYMEIQANEVKEKIVGKSENRFEDRFGNGPDYYLYYFSWKPTISQGTLL